METKVRVRGKGEIVFQGQSTVSKAKWSRRMRNKIGENNSNED